jgi:hypothetical protein
MVVGLRALANNLKSRGQFFKPDPKEFITLREKIQPIFVNMGSTEDYLAANLSN